MGKWSMYRHRGRADGGGSTINTPGEFDYFYDDSSVDGNLTSGDLGGLGYWQMSAQIDGEAQVISDPSALPAGTDISFGAGDIDGWANGAWLTLQGRWCNSDASVVGAWWDVQRFQLSF